MTTDTAAQTVRLGYGPVIAWETLEHFQPFNPHPNKNRLRIRVTYHNAKVRILPPSFKTRADLDRYVSRFHPELAGKERVPVAVSMPDAAQVAIRLA